jgi:hypothetical protein
VVSATNINVKKDIQTTTSGADVPVWKVGDSWTYEENQSCYNYDTHGNITFIWNFEYTSTYTVTKDTGDSYTLKMTAKNVKGGPVWGEKGRNSLGESLYLIYNFTPQEIL